MVAISQGPHGLFKAYTIRACEYEFTIKTKAKKHLKMKFQLHFGLVDQKKHLVIFLPTSTRNNNYKFHIPIDRMHKKLLLIDQ